MSEANSRPLSGFIDHIRELVATGEITLRNKTLVGRYKGGMSGYERYQIDPNLEAAEDRVFERREQIRNSNPSQVLDAVVAHLTLEIEPRYQVRDEIRERHKDLHAAVNFYGLLEQDLMRKPSFGLITSRGGEFTFEATGDLAKGLNEIIKQHQQQPAALSEKSR